MQMASPPPATKQSSRWGGFLQQAVASVESRLDTILADEEDRPPKNAASNANPIEQPASKGSMSNALQGSNKTGTESMLSTFSSLEMRC